MPHNRRFKILHLIEATLGGPRQHITHLLGNLDQNKYAITLGYARGRADQLFSTTLNYLQTQGISTIEIDMGREIAPWRDWRSLRNILTHLRQARYDVVHTHSAKAGFLGRLAAKLRRVPVIIHRPAAWSFMAGQTPFVRQGYAALERLAGHWCDAVIVVSRHEAKLAAQYRIVPPEKIVYIANGVAPADPATFAKRTEIRSAWGVGPNDFVIGSVTRLCWQKDPVGLISALSPLLRVNHRAQLILIGDGPLFHETSAAIERLALSGRVRLLGFCPNIPEQLAGMDCFVLASRYEGLSYALLEAMAAGLPIVTTAEGNTDAVSDGQEGFIVPYGDAVKLQTAVRALIENPSLRQRMGQLARQRAKNFSIPRQVAQTEALYDRLLKRKISE